MSAGARTALLFTLGFLLVACAYLGYRTHSLSQAIASLQSRTIPHDIKQVMARKLYYADKTWHAGEARDWQAAGWYAWQVWRMGNSIAAAGIENSNGPLAELEQSMFLPTIDPLLETMRNDDVAAFEARYRDMVAACNACHAATEHAYVRIRGSLSTTSVDRCRESRSPLEPIDDPARSTTEEYRQRLAELDFHAVLSELCPNPVLGFLCGFLQNLLKNLTICRRIYELPNPERARGEQHGGQPQREHGLPRDRRPRLPQGNARHRPLVVPTPTPAPVSDEVERAPVPTRAQMSVARSVFAACSTSIPATVHAAARHCGCWP